MAALQAAALRKPTWASALLSKLYGVVEKLDRFTSTSPSSTTWAARGSDQWDALE